MEEIVAKYPGKDNHGNAKADYINRVAALDNKALEGECKSMIWLSAYANNNPRSDYHWQADALWDVCSVLNKRDVYSRAYERASS